MHNFVCPFTLANCFILYSQKGINIFFFLLTHLLKHCFEFAQCSMLILPIIGTNGDHLLETVFHAKTYILIMSAIPYKTEAVVNAMMTASGIQPVIKHWTLKIKTELLEMIFDFTTIILLKCSANPHFIFSLFFFTQYHSQF